MFQFYYISDEGIMDSARSLGEKTMKNKNSNEPLGASGNIVDQNMGGDGGCVHGGAGGEIYDLKYKDDACINVKGHEYRQLKLNYTVQQGYSFYCIFCLKIGEKAGE